MKVVYCLVVVGLLSITTGCKQQCLEQQASVAVDITASRDRVVSDWAVLDRTTLTTIQTVGSLSREGQLSVLLPLNLNATQTRYALQIDGRPDTLTVRYGTSVRFLSQRCGYVVDLIRPARGPVASRQLGVVDSVFYSGELARHPPRFFPVESAMLIKLKL